MAWLLPQEDKLQGVMRVELDQRPDARPIRTGSLFEGLIDHRDGV